MKLNKVINLSIMLSIFININSCKTKNEHIVRVFNFDNKKDLSDYSMLNLDENHPNLLDFNKSKTTKNDINKILKSWTDLQQRIGKFLSENKFSWEINEPSVSVYHKFYCDKNGYFKNYFFRIRNPQISSKKKKEYKELISKFMVRNKINFSLNQQFAQCGKAKYQIIN